MLRFAELTLVVVVGTALGAAWPGGTFAVALGALGGAWLWLWWDARRARRLLRWLDDPVGVMPPDLGPLWDDIASRARRAFKALNRKARKANARLQAFLSAIQASPNGIVLLDKQGCIEWCNLMAGVHLGFDARRDIGQRIRNLVRDPAFIAYLNRGDYRHPIEIEGRDARPGHPQHIAVQLFPYSKGRRLMLTRDVTAIELAEAMRRDFVANVSHEIRSPLTVISGFIETLQTLELSAEERAHFLALMQQQAQRMQNLVSDLLLLSRLEGSPPPDESECVAVADWVSEALTQAQALSNVLHGGSQTLSVVAGPPRLVVGARSELLSALGNLLSNAVRYAGAQGHIDVGWQERADGGLEVWVRDDGPGIAPEHLPRLTERFYRVDRSRSRESGGTGLGLAIVKHVIQRHGGELLIDSVVGQGSTFRLTLPPARIRPAASAEPSVPLPHGG
ncbi:phosphate regulon sensor histidine kinase PhoR [Tepidimonas charontis]|uniref:Phosphate regulon sensor protein PhoR n=1 Tax=Tepidimonas charontis TaxID=2267262 RepID=A0A554XGU6_9BURK|nr:phosphate regulon sensor histidine kinase PhoR [Tepidimonas charontis]TSE35053.1 Phosphate regulon sensor protein PhoR [Tepidimonas charontis]